MSWRGFSLGSIVSGLPCWLHPGATGPKTANAKPKASHAPLGLTRFKHLISIAAFAFFVADTGPRIIYNEAQNATAEKGALGPPERNRPGRLMSDAPTHVPRTRSLRRLLAWAAWGAAMAAFAGVGLAHPGDPKARDRRPPYPRRGVRGRVLTPDERGMILQFPASGVRLLSWITIPEFPSNSSMANEVWGYVSPSGREYAIFGLARGTAFVEVTDPVNPRILSSFIPASQSIWHDTKVFGEFAFHVNDLADDGAVIGVGIQVIDLRQIDSGTVTLATSLSDLGFFTAHNIAIDEQSGFAYACGANVLDGGLLAVDIRDPLNPQIAGAWTEHYVHDAQVVTYTEGPYAGREIAFAATTDAGLTIVDVTDKSNMTTLGALKYPTAFFTHQCWLSEDRRYLFVNDESDELLSPAVNTTTTYVLDVTDLENPTLHTTFTTGLPSIDHNIIVRGDLVFEANYRSGVRIFDVSNIDAATEIGYFDTYPEDDAPQFNGAWTVYPLLPSGVLLVSDFEKGLFILDAGEAIGAAGVSVPSWKRYE